MREEEIINQIKDLIKDRESFITENLENDDEIFKLDKMALERYLRFI